MIVRTERTDRWIDRTERWTNVWKDRNLFRRMDGWTDGWRDEGAKFTDREMTDT
jgi:hypothetical protein